MYYETTMHESRHVANANEAAKLIHEGNVRDFDALRWKAADGREFVAVADNHCNNPWFEVAVIDLTNKIQIESITFGWVKTLEEAQKYLRDCETGDFRMGTARLPLDGNDKDTKAHFECGCCGTSFTSTLAEQRKFDQDNGYGICPDCCGKYADWEAAP